MLIFQSFKASGLTFSRLHQRLLKSFKEAAISLRHLEKSILEGNLYLGPLEIILRTLASGIKHPCVLIHIWTKGEVGAPLNQFKPSSKIFLLTVPRLCFFCGSFMLFLSCFVLSCTSVCWCLMDTCLERDNLLALVCGVLLWRCHFPIGILGQVWCLIVSIPDVCPVSYLHG